MKRDTKIDIVMTVVGLMLWVVAVDVSLLTFVVLCMIVDLAAARLLPTQAAIAGRVRIYVTMGPRLGLAFIAVLRIVFAVLVWYIINWLFN